MSLPSLVNRLPQALRSLAEALLKRIDKKELVLFNDFIDVDANESITIDLTDAFQQGDETKYDILLSRVNIMVLIDDSNDPQDGCYKPVGTDCRWFVSPDNTLIVFNDSSENCHYSVFVSANRA